MHRHVELLVDYSTTMTIVNIRTYDYFEPTSWYTQSCCNTQRGLTLHHALSDYTGSEPPLLCGARSSQQWRPWRSIYLRHL